MERYNTVGSSPYNRESWDKVTGVTQYIDDLRFKGMLYAALLFSPHAHAKIVSIDASQALALEGVHSVIHCFNTPDLLYNSAIRFYSDTNPADMPCTERVFGQEVLFVGDRVAAVAADSEALAREAVKHIKVGYELLPSVLTLEDAVVSNAAQASPFGVDGSNLCGGWVAYGSDGEEAVLERVRRSPLQETSTFRTSRVHHGYMEPVAHVALFSPSRTLTVWTSSQSVFSFRDVLSQILGLPQNAVRVIKTVSGGAFGGKLEVMHEPVVALLSMQTMRPVKIRLNRKEVFSSTRTRHEARITLASGYTPEGKLIAQHVYSLLNTGAYAGSGPNTVGAQSGKTFVQYGADAMFYRGGCFYTNSAIAGAMRGYGCPQIMVSREVHMEGIARKLGIDSVQFRLNNLLAPDSTNCMGKPTHQALGIECLQEGAKIFCWDQRRAQALVKSTAKVRYGIGVGTAVHGSGWYPVYQDMTSVTMMMNNDGSLQILTGIHDLGTGAKTVLAQIASEALHIPLDCIEVVEADTAVTPLDLGAQASRSTYIGGNCVLECSLIIKEQLLREAANIIGVAAQDLHLGTSEFIEQVSGKKVSFSTIIDSAQKGLHGKQRQIAAVHSYASHTSVYSYSAVFAEISISVESGTVKVEEILCVHNSGTIINPALCEGQVHGGVQMGLGYALSEEMELDAQRGNITNPTFKNYHMFRAHQMPKITVKFVQGAEPSGPYGAKGIGECATDGVAGAVVNAISHALGGVTIDHIPVNASYVQKLLSQFVP
ncbi:MAG: molybdopterin-dependent oxidoreductase [Sphaerochaeta sp.]|nr:molybdopterin-dependent oxidoreductase [Sphaerochaeta sp.]